MQWPSEDEIRRVVETKIQQDSENGWFWGRLYEDEFMVVALLVSEYLKSKVAKND